MRRALPGTLLLLALCSFKCAFATQPTDATLDRLHKTSTLVCGIDQNEAEFSTTDDHGSIVDFDRELCKAAAVAVIGRDAKVVIKGYPDDQTSLAALRSGEIDVVASISADFTHSTDASIQLTRPVLYDSVGVMVPTVSNIATPSDLSGHKICFLAETEVEVMLRTWFEKRHLDFIPFPFQEEGEMEAAYVTGNCTGLAGDITRLATSRVSFGAQANKYKLLPEILSKDPLALAYRSSDAQWGRVLEWTINALIQAEESGVTASNVESMQSSHDPAIARLLGKSHEVGRPLGLDENWAAHTIQAVGNYGEIFARDLGPNSQLKIPRGQNELWDKGGLMYALPLK
ncbi:type 2 periplasmic-binding domain-containing protein [Acidicapsa ligni]|uniref:transporter substrate-binding domain-containing protein n=1 Tax=Acidicapsa ligni TaxID=542300 RepID=UPI0021E048B2|nr:transporter substrate-binding domain-containing protein [Acidicapsa ligni]